MPHAPDLHPHHVADYDLYLLKVTAFLNAMERYAAGLLATSFPPWFSLN